MANCAWSARVAHTHLPYVRNRCWPLLHANLISHATTMSSGAAEVATACSNLLSALHFSRHNSSSLNPHPFMWLEAGVHAPTHCEKAPQQKSCSMATAGTLRIASECSHCCWQSVCRCFLNRLSQGEAPFGTCSEWPLQELLQEDEATGSTAQNQAPPHRHNWKAVAVTAAVEDDENDNDDDGDDADADEGSCKG